MADIFAVSLHAFAEEDHGSSNPEAVNPILRASGNSSGVEDLEWVAGSPPLLSLLVVISTSLSIVGVVLAFITYSLFSDLRTISGTSLLNLLAALFLGHLLSVIGVERIQEHDLCSALAFLLHFLWLSAHTWLAAMCRDMYRTFRDNLNLQPSPAQEERKSLWRCALFSWGTPAVITGLAYLIHRNTHLDSGEVPVPTCWIIGRYTFVYFYSVPAGVMALVDAWYFCQSAVVIRYTSSMQMNRRTRDKMRRRRFLQLFLYVKLLVLLMATWFCATVSQVANHLGMWYAFCCLASLQGFFVSLSYGCNAKVFRLYSKSFKNAKAKKQCVYGTSSMSASNSLSLLTWQPTPDAV